MFVCCKTLISFFILATVATGAILAAGPTISTTTTSTETIARRAGITLTTTIPRNNIKSR
jgi:hypothetical protein